MKFLVFILFLSFFSQISLAKEITAITLYGKDINELQLIRLQDFIELMDFSNLPEVVNRSKSEIEIKNEISRSLTTYLETSGRMMFSNSQENKSLCINGFSEFFKIISSIVENTALFEVWMEKLLGGVFQDRSLEKYNLPYFKPDLKRFPKF